MTGASLSLLQRANAAAAAAAPAPNLPAALVSAPTGSNLGAAASEVNKVRIVHVANRLALHLRGGCRSEPFEFFQLCFALARGIDYAVSHNDVPPNVQDLPPLIKQVYQRRSEAFLQSAIMVLLISAKNACRDGWFKAADSHDLLSMANEMSNNFCMADSITPESTNVLQVISNVISRFYPLMKLNRLIASFEVKPGYDILVADIYIPRNISTEERIRLFVAQSNDATTSNCIITPSQVNFLINGKAVERRTNVSMDNGPQLPSDITKMLKYGMNLFQAIGSFTGNYVIAIAVTGALNSSETPTIQDYDAPAVPTVPSDSEVIEGPSRISLSCPISFKRIKVPVKGHLCKHHQCFDFDNFMDMNSRKPSWRCPHCNQPVSYIDIRLDQYMVKILREAGDDVSDVVISADGSWKVAEKQQGNMSQLPCKTLTGHSEATAPCDPSGFDSLPSSVVDLTNEDDSEDDAIVSSGQLDCLNFISYQDGSGLCEAKDRKPSYADLQALSASSVQPLLDASELSQATQQLNWETGPGNLSQVDNLSNLSSDLGCGISHAAVVLQPTSVVRSFPEIGEAMISLHSQQPHLENSMMRPEFQRQSIPRHVIRTPIAIQALPALAQGGVSQKESHTSGLSIHSTISSNTSSCLSSLPTAASSGNNATIALSKASDVRSTPMPIHSFTQPSLSQAYEQAVRLPIQSQQTSRMRPIALAVANQHVPVLQPHVSVQTTSRQPLNLPARQTTSQVTSTLTQPSRLLPVQVQQTSRNATGLAPRGSGKPASTMLADIRAVHAARLHSGATPSQTPPATPSPQVPPDNRPQAANFAAVPLEQNWRPTGRMRGSLTGGAYSAAINRYLAQPSHPSTPSAHSTVNAGSNQNSVLDSSNAALPNAHQTNSLNGGSR